MKVFVFMIDALEYNLVEKYDLHFLKQKQYGKIVVPVDPRLGIPLSPTVWSSFLTGQIIHRDFVTPVRPLTPVFKIMRLLRGLIGRGWGLHKKLKKLFPACVHGQYFHDFPKVQNSFLEKVNSVAYNVPGINYDAKVFELLKTYEKNLEKLLPLFNKLYEKRKREILRLPADADLVCAYIHEIDFIQHFCPNEEFIKQYYYDLDSFAYLLKQYFPKHAFIIVSDHGFDFRRKNHSLYAFYSSSISLFPKPKRITDFHDLILRLVKSPSGKNTL